MTSKTHLVAGLIAGEAAAYSIGAQSPSAAALCVGAALAGSIMPDIDQVGSSASYRAKWLSLGLSFLTYHRGPLHTPFIAALASFVALVVSRLGFADSRILARGLFFGLMSHLILDTFNYNGIMWLYPFKKKHYHLSNMKNRSSRENWLMVFLLALAVLSTELFLRYAPGLAAYF